MTKIILFNGPPGSGKDTYAMMIQSELNGRGEIVKFASPLKTVAMHLYCGGDSRLFHEYDLDQEKKVTPSPVFLGKTCRQVQIDISEEYMKPMHGQQVFGKLLAQNLEQKTEAGDGTEVFLVSDSGFRPEAEVLVEQFGPQNVMLVRIHREECPVDDEGKFVGDSRGYINLDDLEVYSIDVTNVTGEVNQSVGIAVAEIKKFIGE